MGTSQRWLWGHLRFNLQFVEMKSMPAANKGQRELCFGLVSVNGRWYYSITWLETLFYTFTLRVGEYIVTSFIKKNQQMHLWFWYFPHRVSLLMSTNVPTMTTLIYVFYSPLESHRSTRFGVFSVHHLQEHLIVFTSVVFPVHFQHYVCLCSSEWFKRYKTCTSLSQFCTKHFYT